MPWLAPCGSISLFTIELRCRFFPRLLSFSSFVSPSATVAWKPKIYLKKLMTVRDADSGTDIIVFNGLAGGFRARRVGIRKVCPKAACKACMLLFCGSIDKGNKSYPNSCSFKLAKYVFCEQILHHLQRCFLLRSSSSLLSSELSFA